MTKEQFQDEKDYRISISVINNMLNKKLISEKDYRKIDTKLKAKYRPIIGSI